MTEPSLRDRAAAVGAEIHELRRQAAFADDVRTLVPLKEADRALKREFGRGENVPGDSYSAFKERLCEQLYEADKAEEQVVQRRIESLTANVRREVEVELAAERAGQRATAAALQEREHAVTERERRVRPSYRARFVAAGVLLAVSGDVLVRSSVR
jgi:hypothetical protein